MNHFAIIATEADSLWELYSFFSRDNLFNYIH